MTNHIMLTEIAKVIMLMATSAQKGNDVPVNGNINGNAEHTAALKITNNINLFFRSKRGIDCCGDVCCAFLVVR